jgi:1-acyl-sn-glycerol-3-phosphate acyltransferase
MARSFPLGHVLREPALAEPEPLLYRLFRAPARRAFGRFFGLAVEGLEHLPPAGPYIVAANHHNYLDGVVLQLATPRPIAFIVMPRVWRATPVHPLFHRHIGSIPISLERPDVGALRRALARLAEGRVVGIFPEGPFSVRGRLERGLPGVALLALRSGVPVVPAGISGTYEALVGRWGYVPRKSPLAVRFGPPRRFTEDAGDGRRSARERVTRRIMDDIAALLP